jgi:hypothetical protein
MSPFPYSDHQIFEFVKVRKTIEGGKIVFKEFEKNSPVGSGRTMRAALLSEEIGAVSLELLINAPILSDTTKYKAVMLADRVRIRGIDFFPMARKQGYKIRIPEGWHQNIDYPSHSKDNRHDPLDLGAIADLADFSRKICKIWNIEYPNPTGQSQLF